jgi:hypothetical protein
MGRPWSGSNCDLFLIRSRRPCTWDQLLAADLRECLVSPLGACERSWNSCGPDADCRRAGWEAVAPARYFAALLLLILFSQHAVVDRCVQGSAHGLTAGEPLGEVGQWDVVELANQSLNGGGGPAITIPGAARPTRRHQPAPKGRSNVIQVTPNGSLRGTRFLKELSKCNPIKGKK